jgi:hypothetical protein
MIKRMRLLLLLCSVALAAQEVSAVDQLQWISGRWTGTLGRASLEEVWLPPSGGAMLGVSRTIAGPRMIAFEFLRIVQKDGDVYYIAQPSGRPPPPSSS